MAASDPISAPAGSQILAVDWDPLEALTSAWTNYAGSLSWTGSGGNPAIVDGTITARYTQAGKLVIYAGDIQMGPNTTFGSGNWAVSLPVTALGQAPYVGSCLTYDAGTAANRRPAVVTLGSTTTAVFWSFGGTVTPTVPFTWANGDILRWCIQYEAA